MAIQHDPVLVRAENDLQRAESAVTKAAQERDEIAAFIRRHKLYANGGGGHSVPKRGKNKETLAEAIEAVLGASSSPMTVSEIVAALKSRGRQFAAKDPAANVSSTLSRADEFHFEKGRGWKLGKA